MRDTRGNYVNLKEITDNGPEWAAGCGKCNLGIVSAPPLTRACDLWLERLCQAIAGDVHFCDCEAGIRFRVSLLNRRQALIEEARKDGRMQEQARRLTHPDIEIAQWRIARHYESAPAPTIHADGVPA